MKKNRKQKILAWILTVAMVSTITLPFPSAGVYAAEVGNKTDVIETYVTEEDVADIESVGAGSTLSITSENGRGWSYDESTSVYSITEDGTYTIKGQVLTGDEQSTPINAKIEVADVTANITINNVNLSSSSGSPFYISESANVNLYLEGNNTLKSTGSGAGLQFGKVDTNPGSLVIDDGEGEGLGSLNVSTSVAHCAGIGGGRKARAGYMTFNGGRITASGGRYAAGIGSGGETSFDGLMINGGIIKASGGSSGAGIGAGVHGSCNNIKITGGTIWAYNIGATGDGVTGNIYISGGNIYTSSAIKTAVNNEGGKLHRVAVNAQENLTAVKLNGQTDYKIGGSLSTIDGVTDTKLYMYLTGEDHAIQLYYGENTDPVNRFAYWNSETETFNIINTNPVKPTLNTSTYFYTGDVITPTIEGTKEQMKVVSGTASATNLGNYEMTIGLKKDGMTWSDGTTDPVVLSWEIKDAPISGPADGWEYIDGYYHIKAAGAYTVDSNNEEMASGIYIDSGVENVALTLKSAKIMKEDEDEKEESPAFYIGSGASVDIILEETNILVGEYENPALLVDEEAEKVTISGTGSLEATGGADAPGITAYHTTIAGGEITAIGGYDSAGIRAYSVTITGGKVTATGGYNGAGIGSGYEDEDSYNVKISGGNVVSTGGVGAAGIGAGAFATPGEITISSGTVTAVGGEGNDDFNKGDAIGCGVNNDPNSSLIISGGSVKAVGTITEPIIADKESKTPLYLAKIEGQQGVASVKVDGTDYLITQNHPEDDAIYLYLSEADHMIDIVCGGVTNNRAALWNEADDTFTIIDRLACEKPKLVKDTFYDIGTERKLDAKDIEGFDSRIMTISEPAGTTIGEYETTISLKDKVNYRWKDGSTDDVVLKWQIVDAPITSSDGEWEYNLSYNVYEITKNGEYIVDSNGVEISDVIYVQEDLSDVTLTLRNANISSSIEDVSPLMIAGGSTVNLILEGTNILTGGDGMPAVFGDEYEAKVTISGAGSLKATGGKFDPGILVYKTTIVGGNITAIGGENDAGIDAYETTIAGGNITAIGGKNGAGINAYNLTISGGNVIATGGYGGAGIGNGYESDMRYSITISGGNVVATGGVGAAGIGAGAYAAPGEITISGGTVTAVGGEGDDDFDKGDAIGFRADNNPDSSLIISGGSVKTIGTITEQMISDKESKTPVYLIKIEGQQGVSNVKVDGTEYPIAQNHPEDDAIYLYLTAEKRSVETVCGEVTHTYQLQWDQEQSAFTVIQLVTKPQISSTSYVYTGSAITLSIGNLDSTCCNVTGNRQTAAGTYKVVVSLKDKMKYMWADGTQDDIEVSWTITKATRTVAAPELSSQDDSTIVVKAAKVSAGTATVQYGYATSNDANAVKNWQTSTTFTGLQASTTYYLFAKVNEDNNYFAAVSRGTAITTKAKEEVKATSKETSKSNLVATAKKTAVTLKWKKISGAQGYEIYGAKSNGKLKKLKTITKGSTVKWTQKGCKKGTAYKYYVKAYAKESGKKVYLDTSMTVYVSTTGGKLTNVKSIKVKSSKLSLKRRGSQQIKTTLTLASKSKKLASGVSKVRYVTSNSDIATVNSKGTVKAKAKGTCYVYVYAPSGISKSVKVTVR